MHSPFIHLLDGHERHTSTGTYLWKERAVVLFVIEVGISLHRGIGDEDIWDG
jgi:hypothetical protein